MKKGKTAYIRRGIAALLAFALIMSITWSEPAQVFGTGEQPVSSVVYATRGQVVSMILSAADDYNPGVSKEDIIKGYGTGDMKEGHNITRAEAFVMISRGFGKLPEPKGDNLRKGLVVSEFSDVPEWARADIDNLRKAGVINGVREGTLGAKQNVTVGQMTIIVYRIYALFGKELKDDFYATVNKEALETMTIDPGAASNNAFAELDQRNRQRLAEIIWDLEKGTYQTGTKEQKISDFYKTAMDFKGRDKAGIDPIKTDLYAIDKASNIAQLEKAQLKTAWKIGSSLLMSFYFNTGLKDSNYYMLYGQTIAPVLPKDVYAADKGPVKEAYLTYLTTLLTLAGESKAQAEKHAGDYYAMEKDLATYQLDPQNYSDVDKIYNLYTLQQLQALYPASDIAGLLKGLGYPITESICFQDEGLLKAYANYYTNENIDLLKTTAKLNLLMVTGGTLSKGFFDADNQFIQAYYGTEGSSSREDTAMYDTQEGMSGYLEEVFVEKYFSAKAKREIEDMVDSFIAVYKKRLTALPWMSESTKVMAKKKLDTMEVHIGHPDDWSSYLDWVDIRGPQDGGTYFENTCNMAVTLLIGNAALSGRKADKTAWFMPAFTVNAMYEPTSNSIWFPAGILQAPFYDVNAKKETNLGGIGAIIAHEITHAFDNNGAKFDEKGNAKDWWTPADYAAFQELCEKVIKAYDGVEIAPGISNNGTMTLSENIADLGGLGCALQVASQMKNPDYDEIFRSWARIWQMTSTREYAQILSQIDVHSADKIRVNRTLMHCELFYPTYDVKEGDGMYLPPTDRVVVWISQAGRQ